MAKTAKRRLTVGEADFLKAIGVARQVADYPAASLIFSQGDEGTSVMFIQKGTVKLSVVSETGKEAVVGLLKSGDFLGEGCLAGQRPRNGSLPLTLSVSPHLAERLSRRLADS